jgi:hypothetical protein
MIRWIPEQTLCVITQRRDTDSKRVIQVPHEKVTRSARDGLIFFGLRRLKIAQLQTKKDGRELLMAICSTGAEMMYAIRLAVAA